MLGMMIEDSVMASMIAQAILLLSVQALPPPLLFLRLLSVEVGVATMATVATVATMATSSKVALPLPLSLSLPLHLSGVQGMV